MPTVFTPFKQKVRSAYMLTRFHSSGHLDASRRALLNTSAHHELADIRHRRLPWMLAVHLWHSPPSTNLGASTLVCRPWRLRGVQVEARCTPRAPLPTPAAGSLPLPTGLPALKSCFEPRTIEDLNGCQAEGTPPLTTQPEPKAPVGITLDCCCTRFSWLMRTCK